MKRSVRIAFTSLAAVCLYVASGPGAVRLQSAAFAQLPTTVNLGRPCYSVLDFGADPTGVQIATKPFRAAFAAASLQQGLGVCAPAGSYAIDDDITLYSNLTTGMKGGPSFYGDGPGLTVINFTGNGNLFDSCPTFSDVTPSVPIPSACPPLPMSGGAPNPGSPLVGIIFTGFSVNVTSSLPRPTATLFYFPNVDGMIFDDVCALGAPGNVFDFGQRTANSFTNIIIRDATCQTQYAGHFLALHGGGSGLIVERLSNRGSASHGVPSVLFDSTDIVNGSVSHMTWSYNDFEGPFVGFFSFLPALPASGGTAASLSDSEWIGNVFDHCFIICYYFAADTGQAAPPHFGNLRLQDRWALSDWAGVELDGAFYPNVGTGVQGLQIAGPSLYGGSSTGMVGNGGSLSVITAPATSAGFAMDGTAVEVQYGTGEKAHATALPGDTADSLAGTLIANLAVVTPPPGMQALDGRTAVLANPNYGVITTRLKVAATPGFTPIPYTIITTGILRPVDAGGMTCSVPADIQMPGGPSVTPCATGVINFGDGISLRNGAHDFDVIGARVQALGGASIHMWPNGANGFHIVQNGLGENKLDKSLIAIQLDASTGAISYNIEANDLAGATTPLVNSLPTPAFLTGGLPPTIRNNRGALGVTYAKTAISSGGTLLNLQNGGPLDCTYYFSAWTGTITSSSLTLPGGSTVGLPASKPASVFVPVGATLLITSAGGASVAYLGFCQP